MRDILTTLLYACPFLFLGVVAYFFYVLTDVGVDRARIRDRKMLEEWREKRGGKDVCK